jgi:hypothetical protein
MNKKEFLRLFLDVFIRDNLKHGFCEETKNNYIDKFLVATEKTNVNKLNKLIDNFENVLIELNNGYRDKDEYVKFTRKYRFEQFLFEHDELKEVIKVRKVWLKKKRLGIRNYMQ